MKVNYKRSRSPASLPFDPFGLFGLRSPAQIGQDLEQVLLGWLGRSHFQLDLSTLELLRPELALPAYAGLMPVDGLCPVFHLFDRHKGGQHYSQRVTRRKCRDFRGGRLSYDEHDGTDLICPPGTPVAAAAPGRVVLIRDQWLRGGLTVTLDHGHGLLTQYTHCLKSLVRPGQSVQRGEPLALSGASGLDMLSSFPWLPPHLHFMVWWMGQPVDPFRRKDEAAYPGRWQHGNDPRPAGPAQPQTLTSLSPWNEEALAQMPALCRDPRLQKELADQEHDPAALAALLEDSLHHQRSAWPATGRLRVRPLPTAADSEAALAIGLSLPLPPEYKGIRFADTQATRPRRAL